MGPPSMAPGNLNIAENPKTFYFLPRAASAATKIKKIKNLINGRKKKKGEGANANTHLKGDSRPITRSSGPQGVTRNH